MHCGDKTIQILLGQFRTNILQPRKAKVIIVSRNGYFQDRLFGLLLYVDKLGHGWRCDKLNSWKRSLHIGRIDIQFTNLTELPLVFSKCNVFTYIERAYRGCWLILLLHYVSTLCWSGCSYRNPIQREQPSLLVSFFLFSFSFLDKLHQVKLITGHCKIRALVRPESTRDK
jgi:hypothetical protein